MYQYGDKVIETTKEMALRPEGFPLSAPKKSRRKTAP